MTTTEPALDPAAGPHTPEPALIQGWTNALRAGATTPQAATAALQSHDNATRPPTDAPPNPRNIELLQADSLAELLASALATLATSDSQCLRTADWLWTSGAASTTAEHSQGVALALALMLLAEGAGLEHASVLPFAD